MAEIERLASELPETERALLAAHLLDSLPPVLDEEDEGVAEARKRDADLDSDPKLGMTLEDLDEKIRARRS